MKIFISWSGAQSYSLAKCIADWLPNVIQRAKPFLSSGISKGERWSTVIANELHETHFGVLCITSDNISAPWLLFEAGAISKSLTLGKVAPVLVGVAKDALSGSPLAQFQLTELTYNEMFNFTKSLNESDSDALDDQRLREAFDAFWPKFEKSLEGQGLSSATTAAASPFQSSSDTTTASTIGVDSKTETLEARVYKADATNLEDIVSDVERSDEFESDPDFWTALFAYRRHDLGITTVAHSLKTLHENDVTAFWPLYFLAQQALSAGDLQAASEQAHSLPMANSTRSKSHLESLQRQLAEQLSDPSDRLQHIKTVLSGATSDVSKSATIESYAVKNATTGSDMVNCMLREFALRLNPSDQNIRFNLAHKLAENRSSSTVAFEHYDRVRTTSPTHEPHATHNMAVIATSRGIPALMFKLYEDAQRKGMSISSINLAASILSSGDLQRAHKLLDSIKDKSAYQKNYDAARQRLSAAEEKLAQDEKSLKATAKNAHAAFSRFSEVCVRSWLEDCHLTTGNHSAATKGLIVRVDDLKAVSITLKRNEKVEEAVLETNGLCFEGRMSQPGTTVNALSRSVLITPADNEGDDLLVLLWGPTLAEPVELITLTKD